MTIDVLIKISEVVATTNRTCESLIQMHLVDDKKNVDEIKQKIEKLSDNLSTLMKYDEVNKDKRFTDLLSSLEFPMYKLSNRYDHCHLDDIKLYLIDVGTAVIKIGMIKLFEVSIQ